MEDLEHNANEQQLTEHLTAAEKKANAERIGERIAAGLPIEIATLSPFAYPQETITLARQYQRGRTDGL